MLVRLHHGSISQSRAYKTLDESLEAFLDLSLQSAKFAAYTKDIRTHERHHSVVA